MDKGLFYSESLKKNSSFSSIYDYRGALQEILVPKLTLGPISSTEC